MHNPFKNLSNPDFPVFYEDRIPSTNDYAKEILAENRIIAPFAVICGDQFGGKGRRGNSWISEPYTNLTFSVGIAPVPLPSGSQFQITMASSIGLIHFFRRFPTKGKFGIKWPNDVLFGDKKVAGILIEVNVEGSKITDAIIGIGINVNQQNFNDLNGSSLKLITGLDYSLPEVFGWLLEDLKKSFSQWGNPKRLKQNYLDSLLMMGEKVTFNLNAKTCIGVISDLDSYGRIGMKIDGRLSYFQESEISNLRIMTKKTDN